MNKGMYSGQFETMLRDLNPKLQVRRGSHDSSFAKAGIYHWERQWDIDRYDPDSGVDGHWNRICSCSVNYIPERSVFDTQGHVLKRGWREALAFLHDKKLIRIPAKLGGRKGLLDPEKHGYPMVVDHTGKQVGIKRPESQAWIKL